MTDTPEIYLSATHIDRFHDHCRTHPDGPLVQALRKKGDAALAAGPFSVMDKTKAGPSGDKHDFIRMPTYAWPNPDTPDGLPYIIKDGQPGPGVTSPDYDMIRLSDMTAAVTALGWAYLATEYEPYAAHAALLLRTWFTDPATRMNPNLTFSKYTPGDTPPYHTGVIATHHWTGMLQAVVFLYGSAAWTDTLATGLRTWFADYLQWLQTSHQGQAERTFSNNRGTWYAAQAVTFARFSGNDALARSILLNDCPPRLDHQVAPDGTLPEELWRTISFSYTLMTLKAWVILALTGDRLGCDLWHTTFDNDRGLHLALTYTGQFVNSTTEWPHQQIKPAPYDAVPFCFRAAARAYGDAALLEPVERLGAGVAPVDPAAVLF